MRWIAGAAAALFALSASALPAQPTGTRIDPVRDAVRQAQGDDKTAAARALTQFAACSARTRRRGSEALLALAFAEREQSRAARAMFNGGSECFQIFGREMRVTPLLLVGGLAEYYVLTDFEESAVDRVAALTDEAVVARSLAPRNGNEDLALCTVRRDPRAVRTLIASERGSTEEETAVRALVPHLGPCVPAGMTVNVAPAALRALLAAGLYRALVATR